MAESSPAPFIASKPANVITNAGANVALTLTAVGVDPLAFQWFHDLTNILADATNATLTLDKVATDASGVYSVAITNVFGTAHSTPVSLTVFGLSPPARAGVH